MWLINPDTDHVIRKLPLGRQTTTLTFAGGAAWIGAYGDERKMLYGEQPVGTSWLCLGQDRCGGAAQARVPPRER